MTSVASLLFNAVVPMRRTKSVDMADLKTTVNVAVEPKRMLLISYSVPPTVNLGGEVSEPVTAGPL